MKPHGFPAGRTRKIALAAGLWALAYGVFFAFATVRVRDANSDDVVFDALSRAGRMWAHSFARARLEGRFYAPVADGLMIAFFHLRNPWAFSAARTLLVLGEAGAVGRLFARIFHSDARGVLVGIVSLLLLQIPLAFYPVLSFPPVAAGLILFCLVSERLWGRDERLGASLGLGLAALLTCCLNECFVAPLFLVAAFQLATGRSRRPAASTLAALGAYLAAYLVFRHFWPSQYSGTQLSPGLWAALRSLVLSIGATFPGVELLLNRSGYGGGPLLRSAGQIGRILQGAGWPALLLLGLGLVLAALMAGACLREAGKPADRSTWAVLLAVAISFVIPMSLTAKYQMWSYQRQYPYYYALGSWFILLGLAAMAVLEWRRAARAAVLGALGLLTIGVWASNARVIRILEQSPYPVPAAVYDRFEGPR